MDLKKAFDKFETPKGFIRTTVPYKITSPQKVALNRKGNVLFNSGDIEGARRIFETTGYSDGLSRVGDHYKSKGRLVDALRMYWIAPDRTKYAPLLERAAETIRDLIREDKEGENGQG
jgi:hypothetical protein